MIPNIVNINNNHGDVWILNQLSIALSSKYPIIPPMIVDITRFRPTVLASSSCLKNDFSGMLYYFTSKKDLYADLIVFSISLSECSDEIKPASNCDGARYIPLFNMLLKNLENLAVSDFFAVS